MQLTSLQSKTVEEILSHYNATPKVKVDFKAPTGSGKTLMASFFISSLIERNPSEKFIFVIATPSSSALPEFFEKKINLYKADLPYSKFIAKYIPSPSSSKGDKTETTVKILPEQNKVYIFGKASFGKGRILSERNIISDFIAVAVEQGFKIVYIRDEAHIGDKLDNSEEAKQFESLLQSNASFILKMTATPNYSDPNVKRVILKERDINNDKLNDGKFLLKTKPEILLKKDMTDDDILADAIKNFKQIKEEYKSLGLDIKPAMLIQVDNSSFTDKQKQKDFENALAKIKTELTKNALSWVQYFGNNDKDSDRVYKGKFTLDDITQSNNEIDAIIFKIGPSTGWDIPRACMLVQLRNVYSSSLNTQTIGRIKRNPYPNLAKNETTDKYYIYSNADNTEKDFKVFNYKVKDAFVGEYLATIKITNKAEMTKALSTANLKNDINKYLADNKSIFIQQLSDLFEVKNDEFFYKKVRATVNGHDIYTQISNPFIFIKEYKRLLENNKVLINAILSFITTLHKENLAKQKINGKALLLEYFIMLLLEKHKQELLNIVNKNRQHQPQYKIEMLPYSANSYIEMYDAEKGTNKPTIKTTAEQPYLFDIKNGGNDMQPLDSKPEEVVFQKICDYVDDNGSKIKVWAKNLTTSNISGEYLDDNNNTKNSYFDFIIKFANGNYLYMEVKGEQDIDPLKTERLKKAYKDYFAKATKTLFDKPFVISIWKVDTNGTITTESFWDKAIITEDLSTLNARQLLSKLGSL